MEWYYNKGDEVIGTVSEEEILNLIKENTIGKDTLVWNEEMEDWKVITEVSEFKEKVLRKQPPPLPKKDIPPLPKSVESNENQNSEVEKYYHENGNLRLIETLVDGVRNGLFETYYQNGNVRFKVFYKDGLPHGEFESFDERGVLRKKGTYRNGKTIGKIDFKEENSSGRISIKSDGNKSVKNEGENEFIETKDNMKWYKFYTYILIPLGLFQGLLSLFIYYSDMFPYSVVPNPLVSIFTMGVLVVLFIGLKTRKLWGLYLFYVHIILFYILLPIFIYEEGGLIGIHFVIGSLYYLVNYDYFNKRKSLFS